ncbi:Hypothetical protein PHPALM_3454 [Phytophthora palmivora]|uniref:Uncharacterized protein n=1 Tax=Phytophthora palmivora TaxID=4796 RepID=A0A2P4YME5_9STRA|nr:Hypothetical protein PHPALM_3454 [Phytophthora palmivora]
MTDKQSDDRDIHLANAEFAVNSTVNSSTKLAPFEADLGYVSLDPLQLAAELLEAVPVNRCGTEFHEQQAAILLRCREALAESHERMSDVYDRNHVEQVFNVGDRVYLSTKHLAQSALDYPIRPRVGPYTVVRKVHNPSYAFNNQAGNKLHPVFNTGSLKPYKEPSQLSKPNNVILTNGSVGQLVQRLFGKRCYKKLNFLWSGG